MLQIIHPFKYKFLHLFGVYPNLSFKQYQKSYTTTGQILSFLVFGLLCFSFYYIGKESFSYKQPLVNYHQEFQNTPKIVIEQYNDLVLLEYYVQIPNNITIQGDLNFTNIVRHEFYGQMYNRTSNRYEYQGMKFIDCDPSSFLKDSYRARPEQFENSTKFQKHMCLDGSSLQNLTFQINGFGDKTSLVLDFYACKNSDYPDLIGCSDPNLVEYVLTNMKTRLYYKQTNVNPASFKNYITHYYESKEIHFSDYNTPFMEFGISTISFTSDDNMVISNPTTNHFFKFNDKSIYVWASQEAYSDGTLIFTIDQNTHVYSRSFTKLPDIFAQAWALITAAITFLSFLLKKPMVHDFYGQLAQELFEIDDKKFYHQIKKKGSKWGVGWRKKIQENNKSSEKSENDYSQRNLNSANQQKQDQNDFNNFDSDKHNNPVLGAQAKKSIYNFGIKADTPYKKSSNSNSKNKTCVPTAESQNVLFQSKPNVGSCFDDNLVQKENKVDFDKNEQSSIIQVQEEPWNQPNEENIYSIEKYKYMSQGQAGADEEDPKVQLEMDFLDSERNEQDGEIQVNISQEEQKQDKSTMDQVSLNMINNEPKSLKSSPESSDNEAAKLSSTKNYQNTQPSPQEKSKKLEQNQEFQNENQQSANNDGSDNVKSAHIVKCAEEQKEYDSMKSKSNYIDEQQEEDNENFEDSFKTVQEQPDLRLNIFQWVISKFSFSRFETMNDQRRLIEKCQEKLMAELDIFCVLKKLRDIDRLKALLMNEEQRKIFDQLPRPLLSLDKNEILDKKISALPSSVKFLSMGANTKTDLDYKSIYKKRKKTDIDYRLLEMHKDYRKNGGNNFAGNQ